MKLEVFLKKTAPQKVKELIKTNKDVFDKIFLGLKQQEQQQDQQQKQKLTQYVYQNANKNVQKKSIINQPINQNILKYYRENADLFFEIIFRVYLQN